jgi:N-acetylmuramoyl-L-alanine amidase
MNQSLQLPFGTALAAFALGVLSLPNTAIATVFNQQEIDQSRVVAVAAPYAGGSAHQLLILEQISNSRPCWNERGSNPTLVEPLLIDFDFTGICNRGTDSNGYSVRVGGEDLGWRYSLRLVKRDRDLALVAVSNTDRNGPEIEIGRTRGLTQGFSKIMLNPGWRLTKRAFNGEVQGHFYLSNERSLPILLAEAANTRPLPSVIASRPPSVDVRPVQRPPVSSGGGSVKSNDSSVVVPTIVLPAPNGTASGRPSVPPISRPPVRPPVRPIVTLPPGATATNLNYRVIVAANTLDEQNRLREIVPGAFRTTVNGQSVMQAGLFRERDKATELYEALTSNSLLASIVPVPAADISPTLPPVPTPTPPSPRPAPNGRVTVVIDPGHGGGDPGAVGINGLQEKNSVLSISQQVVAFLGQEGIQASLTRPDDQEIDLQPRVQFAEQANADVFVSIHANSISVSRPEVNGLETYYNSPSGQRLAQVIHDAVLQDVGMRDRGVRKANFYVIKYTSMPAVLVEVGFVTGSEDAARLADPAGRTRLAKAIARGIAQYMRANL